MKKHTWNGFIGDSGSKILQIFTILSSFSVVIICSNLKFNNFDLFTTISNLRIISPSTQEYICFACWIAFSWLLYVIIPGKNELGPINVSGTRYTYKLNSLSCMMIIFILYLVVDRMQFFPLQLLSEYTDRIMVTMLYGGLCLSFLCYIKGLYFPTWNTNESKPRGNFIDDFYSGIELTPRMNSCDPCDLKLFSVGHLGMIMWFILNFSHANYAIIKYNNYTSLIIFLLQAIYIIDWAYYERWYLYTIDMQHDRLGYALCFGPISWMPVAYTMYTYYTAHNNIQNSLALQLISIIIFLFGYWLFRECNNQKEFFRHSKKYKIWGKECQYLNVCYNTSDGKLHNSRLLLSGFWGWARHFNYIGDWIMCLALSMLCGFDNISSHIYTIQMIFVLFTRAKRDDERCTRKYGEYWKQYRIKVPYKIIPYIY